jgi:lipopolysaccharide biosynthesis glycosyltransferase
MYLGAVRIGLRNAGVQHVPWDHYFNAGLLLMNLELWRRDDVAGTVRRLIAENDFSCPTQDPMNLVGYQKTVFLPVEYNVYLSPKSMKGRRRKEYLDFHGFPSVEALVDNAAVLHFVENIKPWNDAAYPQKEEWLKYHRLSVFRDVPLLYVHRPSPWRKWTIKIVSMFIFNRKKRRKFREKIWKA